MDRLRCPRRQTRQRPWADRLTPAPRKEVVDPLCLRWPGSACHVGHFALVGRSVPLRTLTICHQRKQPPASVGSRRHHRGGFRLPGAGTVDRGGPSRDMEPYSLFFGKSGLVDSPFRREKSRLAIERLVSNNDLQGRQKWHEM